MEIKMDYGKGAHALANKKKKETMEKKMKQMKMQKNKYKNKKAGKAPYSPMEGIKRSTTDPN